GPRGASSPPTASRAEQKSFIHELWPQAQKAAEQLGVAAENLVAQAALETNWGRSVPQDTAGHSSNNLFGIKASEGWGGSSVSAGTSEFAGATAHATTAQFRAYDSRTQSFEDYVSLLKSNPRYAAALNTGSNVQAFAGALQRGGYATDPQYAHKVSSIASDVASTLRDSGASSRTPDTSAEPLKLASAGPITAGADSLL
ncbi:MAG: glucosaminidase domain-containing protein, partial [Steroidobacteraceae bacterium]